MLPAWALLVGDIRSSQSKARFQKWSLGGKSVSTPVASSLLELGWGLRERRTWFSAPNALQPQLHVCWSLCSPGSARWALTTVTACSGHLHTLGYPQESALGTWERAPRYRNSENSETRGFLQGRGYYKENFAYAAFYLITGEKYLTIVFENTPQWKEHTPGCPFCLESGF